MEEQKFNEQEFETMYKEEQAKYPIKKVNILICGYTGSGKTSLIRAILGDVVPEDAIGTGKPQTMGYHQYENENVCIWDSQGLEAGETEDAFVEKTKEFLLERQESGDVDKHIHLVWYTIQGPGARVTDCDKHLMTKIFNKEHIFVLLTKTDMMREKQKEAMKEELLNSGIRASRIIFTSDVEGGSLGSKELMEKSLQELPAAYRDAFTMAQVVDIERKKQLVLAKTGKAKAIIGGAATAAAAAGGMNPLPLSDAALITPVQLTMIASLAGLYGISWKAFKPAVIPFLAQAAGKATVTSLLKFIPVAGHLVNAGVAAGLTWAMGLYVKSYLEKCALAKIEGREIPQFVFNNVDFEQFRKLGEKESQAIAE